MAVDGIGGYRAVGGATRRLAARGGPAGFAMPEAAGEAGETGAAGAVAGGVMLALQETPAETVGDRPARRRGQAMLDELAALQREMLSADGPNPATLRRLAALHTAVPEAENPGLRDAVAAIRLRAVVELARYGLKE